MKKILFFILIICSDYVSASKSLTGFSELILSKRLFTHHRICTPHDRMWKKCVQSLMLDPRVMRVDVVSRCVNEFPNILLNKQLERVRLLSLKESERDLVELMVLYPKLCARKDMYQVRHGTAMLADFADADPVLVLSTLYLTRASLYWHRGNVTITNDPDAINSYRQEFEFLWKKSQPFKN
jgi:hypothetical protein